MQTISIFQESGNRKKPSYRAIQGQQQAKGKTPGQALDSLERLAKDQEENSLVILQRFGTDTFFSQQQQERLQDLMSQLQEAINDDASLTQSERAELEQLIDIEWAGAIARAAAIIAQTKNP
jgi:hypothetical protein